MNTMTSIVKTSAGGCRELVEALGDVTGMVVVPPYQTILGGRRATVFEWYDEQTNEGWEKNVVTLHDWEL